MTVSMSKAVCSGVRPVEGKLRGADCMELTDSADGPVWSGELSPAKAVDEEVGEMPSTARFRASNSRSSTCLDKLATLDSRWATYAGPRACLTAWPYEHDNLQSDVSLWPICDILPLTLLLCKHCSSFVHRSEPSSFGIDRTRASSAVVQSERIVWF